MNDFTTTTHHHLHYHHPSVTGDGDTKRQIVLQTADMQASKLETPVLYSNKSNLWMAVVGEATPNGGQRSFLIHIGPLNSFFII